MRTGGWIALALAVLLSAPAVAAPVTGTVFERHVERLVATPTPVGPVRIGGDEASWRVTVPSDAVVVVTVTGDRTEPFVLRARPANAPEDSVVLPSTRAAFTLSSPGLWDVRVDPVAGAAVDILARFEGHVGGAEGAPAPFTLEDGPRAPTCVVGGVCLP